ncbi:Uncharacterised protein [Cedecea neteri]|uniref:Uncharacterized protein n=1 Tax=Cedecea neteri TaxID=158822 RepID=A0A2X3JCC2_9ENTR|nr:Uncharacterised protein [Cedecea neteri]
MAALHENKPQLGIYTLSAQLNHFYALSQQHGSGDHSIYAQQHTAIERIRGEYYRVRAVGEDLSSIELTGQNPLTLKATLHVSDDVTDVTWLAATLYHRIGLCLNPLPNPRPFRSLKNSCLPKAAFSKSTGFSSANTVTSRGKASR